MWPVKFLLVWAVVMLMLPFLDLNPLPFYTLWVTLAVICYTVVIVVWLRDSRGKERL